MLGGDEVETVVIPVDAIMNIEAVNKDATALNDTNRVISAVYQRKIADVDIFSLMHEDVVGRLSPLRLLGGGVPRTAE